MSYTTIRFTVRNKGGKSSGKMLEHEVPEFDWGTFKSLPNAQAFVKKAYVANAQRLIRELEEDKNQTQEHHFQSMESLIARSLKFIRDEILEWCEIRDWSRANFKTEKEQAVRRLKEFLPNLSSSENSFPEHLRSRAAEIVAEVADYEVDPVADYLFVKLSQQQKKENIPSDF